MSDRYLALSQIIQEYRNTVTSEDFRIRIRDRELSRLFAFSIHNIYRVLLAIAPIYFEGFAKVIEVSKDEENILSGMGLPGRVFRYFHVILLGACFPNRDDLALRMPLLNYLCELASRKIQQQLLLPEQLQTRFESTVGGDLDNRFAIRLAVYMREFVDYIFLGQHDQGFISYPPQTTETGILVLRSFFKLPGYLYRETLDIFTLYTTDVEVPRYDRFRGDVERLPPPNRLIRTVVLSERESLNTSQVQELLSIIEREFIQEKQRISSLTMQNAEIELMMMFCTELFDLLEGIGEDVQEWVKRLKRSIEEIHLNPQAFGVSSDTCYTDEYISQLKTAMEHIERYA